MRNINLRPIKSVLKIWFISYVLVLLIPLGLNYFLFNHSRSLIERETYNVKQSVLIQLRDNMDKKLYSIKRSAILINQNTLVSSLVNRDRNNRLSNQKYLIYQNVQYINLLSGINEYVDNVMLYLKNSESAIYNRTYVESDYLYEYHVDKSRFATYNDWKLFMNQSFNNEYIKINFMNSGAEQKEYISYASSLPLATINASATLFLNMNHTDFEDTLNALKWTREGMVFILDAENNVIASSNNNDLPDFISYYDIAEPGKIYFGEHNNKKYVALMVESNESNWKYILLTPENVLWGNILHYSRNVFYTIILYIVLGLIIAYVFARRNYKPISKIIDYLSTKSTSVSKTQGDEYKYMQLAFENVFYRIEEMQKELSDQDDLLRRNFLLRFLTGERIEQGSFQDMFKKYNIEFLYKYYTVMIVHTDVSEVENEESVAVAQLIITEYFDKAFIKENMKVYFVIENNFIVFILNGQFETLFHLNKILSIGIEEIKSRINKLIKTKIVIAVSTIHEVLDSIPDAYQEAINALDYVLLYEPEEIVFYNDIKGEQKYFYPIAVEQKLINNIQSGNVEEVQIILSQISAKNFYNNAITPEMGRCLMFDVMGSLMKAVDMKKDSEIIHQAHLAKQMIKVKTLKEMENKIKKNVLDICRYFKEQTNMQRGRSYSKEINQFIDENYMNSELNISMLAEYFKMTPSYLSKNYKDETGHSILQYINKVRTEKAKQLLLDNNNTIAEISNKTGFLYDTSFIRTFKNVEGITPTQYKNNIK